MRIFTPPAPGRKGLRDDHGNARVDALTDEQRDMAGRHTPLARKMARRLAIIWSRIADEIESAAYLGLVEAARAYRPEVDVSFPTYARRRIQGRMVEAVHRETIERRVDAEDVALTMACPPGDLDEFDDTIASLNPEDRELITLRFRHGLTQREAGKRLGRSQVGVGLLEKKALARLREREESCSA